jgi:hypothetical protein
MQLDEFTKKFLPDYKELFGAYKNEYGWKYNSATYLQLAFSRKYFPVALQNFADRICKEQIQLCVDIVTERLDDHETEPFESGIYVDGSDLYNAEQPEIDEL